MEDPEYQLVATYLEHMVTRARHHHVDCADHPSGNDDVFFAAAINRALSINPTGYQDSVNSRFADTGELGLVDGSVQRPSEYWSTKLETTLDTGNFSSIRNLLHENFELVASDKFAWLPELRDLGYSSDEIAEVLLNAKKDSLWIYFKPRSQTPRSLVTKLHRPYCVHKGVPLTQHAMEDSDLRSRELVESLHFPALEVETMHSIKELCGLAGISPSGRDPRKWIGQAVFGEDEGRMTSSIHFLSEDMMGPRQTRDESSDRPSRSLHPTSALLSSPSGSDEARSSLNKDPQPSYRHVDLARLGQNILKAFQGFYSAVAEAQRQEICCNSFTILRNLDASKQAVELCRIKLEPCVSLFLDLKQAIHMLQRLDMTTTELVTARAVDICRPFSGSEDFEARLMSGGQNHGNIAAMLHYSSLAVQLLSLGFLSYNRAHVGAFHPFFLDTAIETVHLHGIYEPSNSPPQISATLLRLTCLEDMIHKPVVVFGTFSSLKKSVFERYDLLTTPKDFIDTWGPGQYVFADTSDAKRTLSAMMIGGGSVKPVAEDTEMLHWSKDLNPRHEIPVTFSANSKLRIGLSVDWTLARKI